MSWGVTCYAPTHYGMDSMDLKTLEDAMHAFVASKGWYDADLKRPQTPRNLAISLVLEASEVLELYQWSDAAPD